MGLSKELDAGSDVMKKVDRGFSPLKCPTGGRYKSKLMQKLINCLESYTLQAGG